MDIVERYNALVKTAFKYAADEKGEAPTSVFEIYTGHFSDIGKELADTITLLTRERDEARAKAIEEAAQVADEHTKARCSTPAGDQTSAMRLGASSIAAAIRRLGETGE